MAVVKYVSLVLILTSLFLSPYTVTTAQTAVSITSPSNNSEVGINQLVTGTAHSIGQSDTLWIVVYGSLSHKWYPQEGAVVVGNNGNWSQQIRVGSSTNSGKRFLIQAVIADSNASTDFKNYLDTYSDNPGMSKLPQGAAVAAQVNVSRAADIFGLTAPPEWILGIAAIILATCYVLMTVYIRRAR
jgi:hypothetical protein